MKISFDSLKLNPSSPPKYEILYKDLVALIELFE
jgi:hypothetical protein